MKKGFTLVELLAVIIILGVILVIAIPSFNNAIKESKIKLYKSINQMVVKSTKEYLTEYVYELPEEEGETIEVTTNDLISNGYLKEISNPTDKNDTCTGYVLITKLENNEYSYIPHINCEEDINNSTEDGLVLHYTFDDFQEPTTNLIYSPFFGEGTHQTYQNFQKTINKSVNSNQEYTLSADFFRNHLHNGRIYAMFKLLDSNNVMIPGNSGLVPNWNATVAEPLYRYFDSNIKNLAINNWYHYALPKIVIPAGYDNGLIEWIRFSIVTGGTIEDITKFKNMQFEQKGYATPFVDGSRTGTVKDYSINNNNAPLSEITTPRWTENESEIYSTNKGYYSFSFGNIISVSDDGNLNLSTYTYSFWIRLKTDQTGSFRRIMGRSAGGSDRSPGFWFYNVNNRVHLQQKLSDGTNGGGVDTSSLNLNQWHHIVFSCEWNGINTILRSWKDGKEFLQNSYLIAPQTGVAPLILQDVISTQYDIDDVRIYSRVLSSNEIEMMYNISKDNYK